MSTPRFFVVALEFGEYLEVKGASIFDCNVDGLVQLLAVPVPLKDIRYELISLGLYV